MGLTHKLKHWSDQQLISAQQVEAILTYEKEKGRSRLFFGLGGLGVLSLVLGVISLIASNWDKITPDMRILGHTVLNLVVAGIILKFFNKPSWQREALISFLAGLLMTFIALIGQTLQTQAPLWQPVGFWLLLATPMLLTYARHAGLAFVWLFAIGFFVFGFSMEKLPREVAEVLLATMPFLLFTFFSFKKVDAFLPVWTNLMQGLFWVLIVISATTAQIYWRFDTPQQTHDFFAPVPLRSLITAGVGTLLVYLLNLSNRKGLIKPFWKHEAREWEIILLVSYGFAAAPLLIPHSESVFLGGLFFCLYWLFMGAMGLRLGIDKLWTLATILVGIRIFIAYIEIMGSLAVQGVGFLLTGSLFLLMAWGLKKIIAYKPVWLLPARGEGGNP
ncbi:MAG: DUF2157 domain-containing protein [Proteobacteria bacterium]|jgi:hypothetical protein|nr:DUF2157 domain-containing protein [Alphaproteobacteria bacterium]NCC04042.1 DUF2157 domain-containing protein [Pseudomonadota bacterium]